MPKMEVPSQQALEREMACSLEDEAKDEAQLNNWGKSCPLSSGTACLVENKGQQTEALHWIYCESQSLISVIKMYANKNAHWN